MEANEAEEAVGATADKGSTMVPPPVSLPDPCLMFIEAEEPPRAKVIIVVMGDTEATVGTNLCNRGHSRPPQRGRTGTEAKAAPRVLSMSNKLRI